MTANPRVAAPDELVVTPEELAELSLAKRRSHWHRCRFAPYATASPPCSSPGGSPAPMRTDCAPPWACLPTRGSPGASHDEPLPGAEAEPPLPTAQATPASLP